MRYLPHTHKIRQQLLREIGVDKIDDLFAQVPSHCLNPSFSSCDNHKDELTVENYFKRLSNKNISAETAPFFIGGGLYYHHIPASVDYIIQRGEFLTSYTPYQPEIAQGTLQYLFEFQTQVCELTGMDIANASLYDGATAAAEAVLMAKRFTKRNKIITSHAIHPHYLQTIKTYAHYSDLLIEEEGYQEENEKDPPLKSNINFEKIDHDTAAVIVQSPNFFGEIGKFHELKKRCEEKGCLLICIVTEIISLGLLEPPRAHIIVGEGQSLGNGMSFGGPTVGLFACKKEFLRHLPGRIVGETTDKDGKRGWVLTLSTREQHIRRDKATSNICTNSGLCALAFTVHLSLLGAVGLKRLAILNHKKAILLKNSLEGLPNIRVLNQTFFNEFVVKLPISACYAVKTLAENNILGGISLKRFWPKWGEPYLLITATEMVSERDVKQLISNLSQIK